MQEWSRRGSCPVYLAIADVESGASLMPLEFRRTFRRDMLVGQGLSAGRYHLSVALRHNLRTHEFPVGKIVVW